MSNKTHLSFSIINTDYLAILLNIVHGFPLILSQTMFPSVLQQGLYRPHCICCSAVLTSYYDIIMMTLCANYAVTMLLSPHIEFLIC